MMSKQVLMYSQCCVDVWDVMMQHWVFGSPHFKTFHKKGYIIQADTQGTLFIQWPVFSQKEYFSYMLIQ